MLPPGARYPTVPEYERFMHNNSSFEDAHRRYSTSSSSGYTRTHVSSSARLTDTQRTHTTSSQSSVVTQASRVQQQQQPDIQTHH